MGIMFTNFLPPFTCYFVPVMLDFIAQLKIEVKEDKKEN